MPDSRLASIVARIDSGNCTHAAPGTYISEKLYGHDDVYNCDRDRPDIFCVGDSRVSYGRVAWLDAITRKKLGDHHGLEQLVIAPIQREVFRLVWTHERYNCRGTPVHSPYYYEFPEVLATITREIRYGVKFGLGTFTLDPFIAGSNSSKSFSWAIGGLSIDYAPPARACFALPVKWDDGTLCTITGLQPNGVYEYADTEPQMSSMSSVHVTATTTGTVTFRVNNTQVMTCIELKADNKFQI